MNEDLDSLKNILELAISKDQNKLKAAAIKIKNSRSLPIKANSILKSRQNLLEMGNGMLENDGIDQIAAKQVLTEATAHLLRIDAVNYLQQNYGGLQFAALHHRNLLMFQWVFEQIYRFKGIAKGIGDLRWIPSHSLPAYHALTFPDHAIPKSLAEFNLRRNLQYSHEKGAGKSLPMIQELLSTRKALKSLDPSNPEWKIVKGNKSLSSNSDKDAQTMQNEKVKILDKGAWFKNGEYWVTLFMPPFQGSMTIYLFTQVEVSASERRPG